MAEDKTTGTEPGGEPKAEPNTPASNVDLDAAAAKYRRDAKKAAKEAETLRAQLEKANASLAEIEEAKKTEQEKAIEAAAEKAAKDRDAMWEQKFTGMAVDHALTDELRSRGYDKDFALLVKSTGEVNSAEDVKEAVDEWLKAKGWPEKAPSGVKVPGFPGSPDPAPKSGADGVWNAERIAKATAEEINANWDKIKAQNPSGNFK